MNDKIYKVILFIAALVMPIVCGGVVYALVTDAYAAFEHFGFFKFLTSSDWSYTEGSEQYGALPFITGIHISVGRSRYDVPVWCANWFISV